jgi:thiamine-phosphate pyrophosphorylase
MRILDASLNRASEGLRVVEDYVRLVLDDPFLTERTKAIRHDLAAASATISALDRHAARDTQLDVGTSISTNAERTRADASDVCAASLKRTEQSLRSLEEYGKLLDGDFAGRMESLRYGLYTLEKAIEVGRSSRDRLQNVRLCVLASGGDSAAKFDRLIGELVDAGVGMIQLRDKHLDDRDLVDRARTLVQRTRRQPPALPGVSSGVGNGTLAIVNDRADIAAAVGADGVHIGQEDLSVKDARAIVGTQMLIGVSTHNIEQARAAVLDGANYLGAGPTFASRTKSFDAFAGLDYLREVSGEIRLPTFAIGGIMAENLPSVLSAGIERVAVGSSVVDASDPGIAARELSIILNSAGPTAEGASPIQSLALSP